MIKFEEIAAIATTGLPETPVQELLIGLESRYSEPWRHYHTAEHIAELLASLTQYTKHVRDPKTIGWAMLYHDAVYDPRADVPGRNEGLSACLAESELPRILSAKRVATVARYIRNTANHGPGEKDDFDLRFFLDADLAILGAPPPRYERYARDIRAEYSHVPNETYREARARILHDLANRAGQGRLFVTPPFKHCEGSARRNITSEIKTLDQKSSSKGS